MNIEKIEVSIQVSYEPTYVDCITHWTRSNRNFFIDEEKYKKILEILEG